MKKILTLALLMLTSCNLFGPTVSKGVYSCTTLRGTIYIEILTGDNCVLYFDGCKENSGYFHIDGETIHISGYATDWGESRRNYDWVTYRFGNQDGRITDSDQFSIEADVTYGDSKNTESCHFTKRR